MPWRMCGSPCSRIDGASLLGGVCAERGWRGGPLDSPLWEKIGRRPPGRWSALVVFCWLDGW
eukprot:4313787-Alexandrium_andersonii.AAC.1